MISRRGGKVERTFRCEETIGASGRVAVSLAPTGQLEVLQSISATRRVTEEPNTVLDFGGIFALT